LQGRERNKSCKADTAAICAAHVCILFFGFYFIHSYMISCNSVRINFGSSKAQAFWPRGGNRIL
jgi:hypothetical protein